MWFRRDQVIDAISAGKVMIGIFGVDVADTCALGTGAQTVVKEATIVTSQFTASVRMAQGVFIRSISEVVIAMVVLVIVVRAIVTAVLC